MTQRHRLLWAKSAKKETPDNWKPVLAHLLDVAACAWEVLDLEPLSTLSLYARDLGYPETDQGRDAAQRWVCALIALHDLGKASPAFEQQWKDWPQKVAAAALGLGWNEGRTGPNHKPLGEVVSHSLISHATLPALLVAHGWNGRVADHLADAVGAHHGFRAKETDLVKAVKAKEQGRGPWEQVRQELYNEVCRALDVPEPPSIQTFSGGPYMRLAGLTSFADWIGSSFELEKFEHEYLDNPARYFELARALAREKLEQIDWKPRQALSSTAKDFAEVFGYMVPADQTFQPRPLQVSTQELLAEVTAPTLLLVEAPMGEGKTEIALYAHLTLQRQLGHRGLYIALPTQATGNAMFGRAVTFLDHVGGGRPLDLQLLHGGKDLVRNFQDLRVQPNTGADSAAPQEELEGRTEAVRSVSAREWFTVRKRALLSEYGVGTVDQALLGVLPVAHQFIRLWGLGNRTVVLDEVHAYDMYTGKLIEELVRWLHALGSSVILMSATLPRARREALLRAYGANDAPDASYPRLTRVSGGEVSAVTVQADASRNKTLEVRGLPENLDVVTARTLELHAQGGVTAVIVNTVQRAQDLRRALMAAGVPDEEVLLFHARARNKDRRHRETQVLKKLGNQKNSRRPARFILLGSQVLEQSLDYDADVMLTDLAPVDLVLQRAGRLHRHARDRAVRAGHAEPVLHIAGLTPEAVPDLKGTAWQYIYQPWTLLRAWAILNGQPTIDLPAQLDDLVQRAYQDADPDGLSAELQTLLRDALARKAAQDAGQETQATLETIGSPDSFLGTLAKDPRWDDNAGSNDDEDSKDERRVGGTRLGDESVTVVPLFRRGGALYLDPDGEKAALHSRDFKKAESPLALVAAIHECSVRLSRYQVVRGLAAHARANVPCKLHWPDVPALRDALPLVLDEQDGRWVTEVNGLSVGYDFELGVIYG